MYNRLRLILHILQVLLLHAIGISFDTSLFSFYLSILIRIPKGRSFHFISASDSSTIWGITFSLLFPIFALFVIIHFRT